MTRELLVVLILGLCAVPVGAIDPEPLTISDGKVYDPDKTYKIERTEKTGVRAWVAIAGFEYRAKPGPNAPPRRGGRETRFMEQGFVWEVAEVNNTKYLLLASVSDEQANSMSVDAPFGWIPDDYVLAYTGLKAPEAIQVSGKDENGKPTKTFVPQKGMIVSTMSSIITYQKNPPPPLFSILASTIAGELAKNQFPDALRREYESAGIKLGPHVLVQPRLSRDGWVITEGERTASNLFSARQQYDLFLKDGKLIGRENPNMVWVFDRPQGDKPYRRKSFVLSNIFFLFKRKDGFALIGSRSSIDAHASESMHGWVREDRLAFWNTAEALEWDYSTTDPKAKIIRPPAGYIFATPEDARAWMTAHAAAERNGDPVDGKAAIDLAERTFLAREPKGLDGRSRQYLGMEMRYPLLETLERHPITGAKLYKIGWFGPFIAEGGKTQTEDRKLAERRQGILNAIQELNTVEILFVIDGTPSMAEYRTKVIPEAIASSLRKFNEIRQSDETFANLKVRVRVVLFGEESNQKLVTATFPDGDTPSGAGRANPAEIVSGDILDIEKRITGLADWLRTQRMLPSQGPDGTEPVFNAVLEGFKTARFGNRSLKYVIVIGDAGDRSRSLNPRAGTLNAVIENLHPEKEIVPTAFVGIRAVESGEADANSVLLRRQFAVLRDEVQRRHGGRASADVFDLVGDSATLKQDIGLAINKQFVKIRETLRQADNDLRQYSEGVMPEPKTSSPLRAILDANKVDVTELAAGGVQVFEIGYAYESTQVGRETVRQLRPVYLMPMKSVRKLRDLLLDITDEGDAVTKDPAELKKFMIDLLMRLINTDDPKDVAGKTIAAEFRRRYGITFQSDFLNIPVDHIGAKISPADVERLLLVARRLDELLKDETTSEWKIKKTEIGYPVAVREGPARKADKFYEFPGVLPNRWVWLDKDLYIP